MTDAQVADAPPAPAEEEKKPSGAVLSLRLPIAVEIGAVQLSMEEVLNLSSGHLFPMGAPEGSQVTLLINGIPVASGDLLINGDELTFAVKEIEDGALSASKLSAGSEGAES